MKRYVVDLRPYSGEEFDRIYHLLDGFSFICSDVANKPKVYQVFWERKESIERITGIPASLVHLQY